MKMLLPIINIALACGLFFFVTDAQVNAPLNEPSNVNQLAEAKGGIKALRLRREELQRSIRAAQDLQQKIDELGATYNNISQADQDRLNLLLPDNVDNIQLIINVNTIAKQNGMAIKDIKVKADKPVAVATPAAGGTVSVGADSALGSAYLSFNVTGTYDAYKKFLADLSRSLRLIDITSSAFNTDDKGVYTYAIELKTYWLKR